jgi:hypothetical protein
MDPQSLCDELGFPVIPLLGKIPPEKYGWKQFQKRLPSEREISAWAGTYHNYAIITGQLAGVVVVDIDSPEAAQLLTEKGLPVPPFRTKTSKGEHWFYRHPGAQVRNQAKIAGTDLDIRADGGYVVGPGSVHPDTGVVYEAIGEWSLELLASCPVFDPSWLAPPTVDEKPAPREPRPATSSNRAMKRAQAWIAKRPPAVEGQGGDAYTFLTAANLLGFGLSKEDALDLMRDWNQTCVPPWPDRDLVKKVSNAERYGDGTSKGPDHEGASESDSEPIVLGTISPEDRPAEEKAPAAKPVPAAQEWQPPLPIQAFRPEFPSHVLPTVVRGMVEEAARAIQTPTCIPAMLALSALSLAALKRYHLRINSTWKEQLSLYTVTAAEPGTRKSPIFHLVTAPLWDYEETERIRAEEADDLNREVIAHKKTLLEGNRRQAAQGKSGDGASMIYDGALALRREIKELELECVAKQLVSDDVTPEAVVSLLAENGGRIGNFSSEGDLFNILAGRYSEGSANFNVFLKSYSGDPVKVTRVSKEKAFIRSPQMALGILTQPSVIDGIRQNKRMRQEGLLARFLYAVPHSNIGQRNTDEAEANPERQMAWAEAIHKILARPEADQAIYLDDQAGQILRAFMARIETELADGGPLSNIRDWGSKLVGNVSRIASLFHLVTSPADLPVTAHHMSAAIELADSFLIPHARIALDQFGTEQIPHDCRLILDSCAEEPTPLRDVRRDHRKNFMGYPTRLDAALAWLVRQNFVRVYMEGKSEGSGRPKKVVAINPLLDLNAVPTNSGPALGQNWARKIASEPSVYAESVNCGPNGPACKAPLTPTPIIYKENPSIGIDATGHPCTQEKLGHLDQNSTSPINTPFLNDLSGPILVQGLGQNSKNGQIVDQNSKKVVSMSPLDSGPEFKRGPRLGQNSKSSNNGGFDVAF